MNKLGKCDEPAGPHTYEQYPLNNHPSENIPHQGGTKLPEQFWKTPGQIQADQILGQKPPVKIVQKAANQAKGRKRK